MNSTRWLVGIFLFYFLVFFSHAIFLQKTVYGDGVFYYSWVRSIIVDRDINFTNDYAHFGVTAPVTSTNQLGNKHPVGTPLFWLPWFAQVHTILRGSGYELPYQLITGSVSLLAALTGLILLYRLLLRSFSPTISLLSALSIAGATNLLFYGAVDTVNSHAVSFLAAVVFLSFLFSKQSSPFLTGCALGFCALVRPQDAVLGMLFFTNPLIVSFARPGLAKLTRMILVLFGALIAFSPQLVAWYALYGTALISPYVSGGETFTFWPPNVLNVLFSPLNGLYLWTPVTLLATIGLLFSKDARRIWFVGVFLAQMIIIGSWSTWWQGASYSGRMFVSILPILSFGLASLYKKLAVVGLTWQSIAFTIIAPLTIINVILILRFLLQT